MLWTIAIRNKNEKKYLIYNNEINIGTNFLSNNKDKIGVDINTIMYISNHTQVIENMIYVELLYDEAKEYTCFDNNYVFNLAINPIDCTNLLEYEFSIINDNKDTLEVKRVFNKEKFKKYILDTHMTKYLKSK